MPVLLERFAQLQAKARERTGELYPLAVIQEAELDGFWIHRCLVSESIESHVVDAASSIAASRKSRRAKTDKLDGGALVRTLLSYGATSRLPKLKINIMQPQATSIWQRDSQPARFTLPRDTG